MARKKSTITTLLFAAVVFALLLGVLNVGFGLFVEAPETPDCYRIPGPDGSFDTIGEEECQLSFAAYEELSKEYEMKRFYFSLATGVVLAVVGLYLATGPFSWALLLAGLVQVSIGTAGYWRELNDITRFSLLVGALVIVSYVGYKKIVEK